MTTEAFEFLWNVPFEIDPSEPECVVTGCVSGGRCEFGCTHHAHDPRHGGSIIEDIEITIDGEYICAEHYELLEQAAEEWAWTRLEEQEEGMKP